MPESYCEVLRKRVKRYARAFDGCYNELMSAVRLLQDALAGRIAWCAMSNRLISSIEATLDAFEAVAVRRADAAIEGKVYEPIGGPAVGRGPDAGDPTPAEIAAEAARIRESRPTLGELADAGRSGNDSGLLDDDYGGPLDESDGG